MTRTDRLKLLAQAIGSDIKAILAKTNLLKTAAYKDIGTTAGTVPQYVGNNGIGGLGYGGLVTNLPASTNLDDLRYITANYSGVFKPIGFPADEALIGAYSLSVIAGLSGVKQVLTVISSTYPKVLFKKYERVRSSSWSEWTLTAGGEEGVQQKVVPNGSSLNSLPKENGFYFGKKSNGITGMPAELSAYIYDFDFFLETMVSPDTYAYVQTLYAVLLDPLQKYNNVVYTRVARFGTFTEWVRLSGSVADVDIVDVGGSEPIGDDLVANSIKVGATSPKIAYEVVRKDVTYSNFGYMEDGITMQGSYDLRGRGVLNFSMADKDIISIVINMYTNQYGFSHLRQPQGYAADGLHFLETIYYDYIAIDLLSGLHAAEKGTTLNGQKFFDKDSYIEAFITYKVN